MDRNNEPEQPGSWGVTLIRTLIWVALIGLVGCTTPNNALSRFTIADVQTAQAIATAGNDAQGVQCWGSMLPVAQAVQGGQAVGLAVATELLRVAYIGASGPCAQIVLPIIIRLGPLLGLASAPFAMPLLPIVP